MAQITRRSFVKTIGLSSFALAGGWANHAYAEMRKPNIVILYADDLGFGDIGCYSGVDVQTPHIDALAASGSRFSSWYSNAPVCSPSRTALLTGRYPRRGGVPGNVPAGYNQIGLKPSEITLAEFLLKNGYRTGMSGKWHQGGAPECRPPAQGFEESFGFYNGCVDYYSHIFYWALGGGIPPMHDLWKNGEEVWENGEYIHHLITREAVRFIRQRREEPFFLYVPFNAPHYPMHAPPEYWERVRHIEDPHRRIQAAMVSVLDDSVGTVMAEIERSGLRDNTLIFFISDNGPSTEKRNLLDDSRQDYHGGSAGEFRGHKFDLYEGGIRIPAVVSWPGVIPAGRVVDDVAATMDVFPTAAEFIGADLPDGRVMDGKSLAAMFTQNAPSPHETIFWENGKQRAVRDGDWKLILNPRPDEHLNIQNNQVLFNIKDDPCETVDLSLQKPELVNRLKEKIEAWEKDIRSD